MDFDRKLIQLVRDKKCLYDLKSKSRQNYMQRETAWKMISFELEKPVPKCKQRWKILRERFIREKKRREISCDKPIKPYERWEHYDSLLFLLPTVQRRRSMSCMSKDGDTFIGVNKKLKKLLPSATESSSGCEAVPVERSTPKSFLAEMKKSAFVSPQKGLFDILPTMTPPSSPIAPGGYGTMINESKKAFTTEIQNKNYRLCPPTPRDENDLFLAWIGKKMNSLSQVAKLRIQEKLFAEVSKELRAE